MTARMFVLAAFLLMLATGAPAQEAAPAEPLMIPARVKKGETKGYPTITLRHLRDFDRNQTVRTCAYGGWIEEQTHEATGFFRVEKIGDRWWLIDPDGHKFMHVAVNAVSVGRIQTEPDGTRRPVLSPGRARAFPGKFGTVERWRDETVKFIRDAGFNGTGSWSNDRILREVEQPLAYTPIWNFMSSYGAKRGGIYQKEGHKGYPNDCIFVFDPEFAAFCDEHAKKLAATKDDPYLLGHFSDNELPFPWNVLDKYLELPEGDPGRKEAERWLMERNGTLESAQIDNDDRAAFRGHVADTYFGIVSAAIRKHDPNHLFLGSRFHGGEKNSRAVFAATGRHVDVVSVNVYFVWTPEPQMVDRWAEWSGRPVIITEWYAKGEDSGMGNLSGAGWTVPTQQDRGHFYQHFALSLLRSKNCVGWHWFKYNDNDPEDLTTDPSNRDSNKGMVDVAYEPYPPLVEAMTELNRVVYPLTTYFDRQAE